MAPNRLTPHQRWLRKVARATDRARLEAARKAVRDARQQKRSARKRARAACKRARAEFRRWVARQRAALRERIAQLRQRLQKRIADRRQRVRACCGKDERERVRKEADGRIAAARAELAELQAERRRERVWSRKDPHSAPIRRAERRAERDHEVESDLTPDELIVWREVRGQIRASDRMSRLEAFRHWLHEHQGDASRIIVDDAERAYAAALKAERRERERAGLARTDRTLRRYVAAELEAVPF